MPEYAGVEPDEVEAFESDRTSLGPSEQLIAAASDVALADERLRQRLEGHRHRTLGVSLRDSGKEDEAEAVVLVIWDYDGRVSLEVEMTGSEAELRVTDIRADDQQPAPSDEEIALAISIARADERVLRELEEDFESMAILASSVEPGDRHYGERRLDVGFGPSDERMPRVRALVDLGQERVLAVGCSPRPMIAPEEHE
jgi:hypothetical protein